MTIRDSTLEFFKAGASDYLRKPFIEEELQAKIEIHLRAKKYVNELEKLNKKLENLAVRDGLTGLFNRRYCKEELDKYFCQASRYNLELSCILLDLDFFKKINDTYGHAFGDLVLVQFAEILKKRVRKADIAARYGGEEFVVLLPSTNTSGAATLAEKIRSFTSQHIFSDGVNSTHVQISVGISSLKVDKPENPDKLVSFADEALYTAKEGGRNRVCLYGNTTSPTTLMSMPLESHRRIDIMLSTRFFIGCFLFLGFCILACGICQAEAPFFNAKVIRIIDGDTLEIQREMKIQRVRIWGIDTPEWDQPYASAGPTVYPKSSGWTGSVNTAYGFRCVWQIGRYDYGG